MRQALAAGCAAALITVSVAAALVTPAQAATATSWKVTTFYSKAAWKASKPKAPILKACTTGTGTPIAMGAPITVKDGMTEQLLGTGQVSRVTLWKEGGRYICKYIGTVPVAPNTASMYEVQVAQTNAHLIGRGDMVAEGWTASFWP